MAEVCQQKPLTGEVEEHDSTSTGQEPLLTVLRQLFQSIYSSTVACCSYPRVRACCAYFTIVQIWHDLPGLLKRFA